MPRNPKKPTLCVNAAIGTDKAFNAIIPPLYTSTTYGFDGFGEVPDIDYGRSGNPTRAHLAKALAALEGGAGATITSSGMAALDLTLNLVAKGGHVIAPHDLYGGTHRLLLARQKQGRFKLSFIDLTQDTSRKLVKQQKPDLLLIETPSNPLMRISDIKSLAKAGKDIGALIVCDNTFLSPVRANPLALGADIVIHSTTKFINGHSDVIGGAVIAKTNNLAEQLAWWANTTGVTASPFDCSQTLRGLRTLPARMDTQEKNAKQIAGFLRAHEKISKVYFPDTAKALAQASGPGAMIAFEIKSDNLTDFFKTTGIFQFAESLGGTESLICHPASMTHRAMDAKAQAKAGISQNLIRLSVGLEAVIDQIESLETMLAAI